jgi:15-cis-phytoene synthase
LPAAEPVGQARARSWPRLAEVGDPAAMAVSDAICKRLHARHGTTYYWATRALPRADQPHVHALYGLCRYADELVDAPGLGAPHERAERLDALQRRFTHDLAAGASEHPVLMAVVRTVRHLRLDAELFDRFFAAMRMDLSVTRYETFDDLCAYMDGSSAVIGEMMLAVLRPADPDAVRGGARTLGVAFQLTNFLRDVAEDLDRGRIYLPQEELARFGADPWRRQADAAWRALSTFEIARIRELYREADLAIAELPPRSANVIRAARILYSGILERIESQGHDVFARRARVPTTTKLWVVGRELAPGFHLPRPRSA